MNGPYPATAPDALSMERRIVRDDEIVSAAQNGLPEAFAELYKIHSRRLYKTIVAITKNPEDAEDALQDTFMRAYLALGTFEGRSSIHSWLTRIAINSALMILRRRRNRPEVLFDPRNDARDDAPCLEIRDSSPGPEQICDLRQQHVRILRAIQQLDPTLRMPMEIRMTHGWSIKEIGHALNISEVAVKTRLHRARRRLMTVRDLKP
ncbi:MAG TPA: sigma-70 family RNA polymerase sigma factor [Verrucomicrobiae bacterium]|nr:sigma-70 family RNA polymerase sigma factor [Verrucomicrobiae bacterium]